MKGKSSRKTDIPFDDALKRLEEIVQQLEAGDLSLEDSIRLFEEGVGMSRLCGRKLEAAERKVEMLVQDQEGQLRSEPFPPAEEE
jgi:exodeoxyribonuclease VII small subunit